MRSRDISVKKSEIAILAPLKILKAVTPKPGISSKYQKPEIAIVFHGMSAKYTFNARIVTGTEKDGTKTTECILLEITESQSSLSLNNDDGELIKSVIGRL